MSEEVKSFPTASSREIYRHSSFLHCKSFFLLLLWVSLHSLSDDLKSHFPTSARSPVKQSADTEAKTLKITSVGVLDDHLPPHAGTVFGYPHSRSYKRRWSVLLSSSSISVFFFFTPPLNSVRWHPILIQACLLIHLPLVKATFPSLHSCLQTFFNLSLLCCSLLLIAFLFSFRWPQKRSIGSLGQSRPLPGFTWQGQAEARRRPDDTYWSCQRAPSIKAPWIRPALVRDWRDINYDSRFDSCLKE